VNGRNFEYLSKDPFLNASIVVPFIKGVQSHGVSATVKHHAQNNEEYNRHNLDVEADERTMREIYLPAFEAAVRKARVDAVMDSCNLIHGWHATQNEFLNLKVLKGEWEFQGILMSDWDAAMASTLRCRHRGSRTRGSGAEMAELYVSDPSAEVQRPERELKGFEKVHLAPGETVGDSSESHAAIRGFCGGVSSMYDSPMKHILLSWSSGKDSAWALHILRQQPDTEIIGLLTSFNTEFQRVAMHGVRRSVLEAQAAAAQLPLWIVPLPWPCSNEVYEQRMTEICARAVREHVQAIAFGDLFLRDVRAYREKQLDATGLEPLFPLWEIPTDQLARDMIAGGLRAKLTCVDPKQLPAAFAGRDFDATLLSELPDSIDPCGERGEFHTCVYGGPMFNSPIPLEEGEVVRREGFVYADFTERNLAVR
jgi:uncharacterized protein (TIGR00290 family)